MTTLTRATGVVATVAIAVLLLAPGLAPLRLSYVTSDSMAPTIEPGDGYLIHRTDDVGIGDVVTFRSDERGGFVTHRIVDRTAEGFLTKGDNNPSTDQAGGMPPVGRAQIEGRVVEVRGAPLTVPGLGPIAGWLDDHGLAAFVAVGLLAVVATIGGAVDAGGPVRDVVFVSDVVVPMFVGVVVVSVGLMLFGTTTEDLTYVVTESGSPAPHTVPVNESMQQRVDLEVVSSLVTTAVVDVEGVELVNATGQGGDQMLWVEVPPRDSIGVYTASVTVYPYPAVLPRSWLAALTAVHRTIAVTASVLATFGPLAVVYGLFMDPRTRMRAPRSRRLRRLLEGGP